MTETKIDNTWVDRLIDDCLSIKIERSHNAEMELIQGRYEIGERLLQDHNNFARDKIYGKKILQRVAESVKMHERILERCIQFARKYKTWENFISTAPKGKAISWRFICNEVLPKHKEKQEKKRIKKDSKIDMLVTTATDHPEKKETVVESIMTMFEKEKEETEKYKKLYEDEKEEKEKALSESKKKDTVIRNLELKFAEKKKEDNIQAHVNKKPYEEIYIEFYKKIYPTKQMLKDGKYSTGLKNISKLEDMTPDKYREVMKYLSDNKNDGDFDIKRIVKTLNPQIIYSNIQLLTNMLGTDPSSIKNRRKTKPLQIPDYNKIDSKKQQEGFFDERV